MKVLFFTFITANLLSDTFVMSQKTSEECNAGRYPETKLSEAEWKTKLTPEQYRVLRQKGTEIAFTGNHYNNKEKGIYCCAGCGNELFSSEEKYDSGSGWPSFWDAVARDRINCKTDGSHGMARVEILCAQCGGHLGHMFDDGPQPTGKRYCVNSVSLEFHPSKK